MKSNAKRKSRLRLVAPHPSTASVELPPGVPDAELPNVLSVGVGHADNAPTVQPGDICVVWMGHPFKSGEFGAIRVADSTVYLGTLRHGPGGYMTLETANDSYTFRPGEYICTGRGFSVERRGEIIKRFPLAAGGAR